MCLTHVDIPSVRVALAMTHHAVCYSIILTDFAYIQIYSIRSAPYAHPEEFVKGLARRVCAVT